MEILALNAAWEAMKRWASSVSDISRLNSATGLPWLMAAFSAMLVTRQLLPIDGRAAITIRLPGWRPPVIASRSANPVGVPVSGAPSDRELVELVELVVEQREIERKSWLRSPWATSSIDRSARSTISRAGSRWSSTLDWIS